MHGRSGPAKRLFVRPKPWDYIFSLLLYVDPKRPKLIGWAPLRSHTPWGAKQWANSTRYVIDEVPDLKRRKNSFRSTFLIIYTRAFLLFRFRSAIPEESVGHPKGPKLGAGRRPCAGHGVRSGALSPGQRTAPGIGLWRRTRWSRRWPVFRVQPSPATLTLQGRRASCKRWAPIIYRKRWESLFNELHSPRERRFFFPGRNRDERTALY